MAKQNYLILPSLEILNKYFYYDPVEKQLYNKITRGRRARIGKVSGSIDNLGYRQVMIDKKTYRIHRIIWYLVYKEDLGNLQIDHIDGNPANNDIKNLRLVTNQENGKNQKLFKNSSSGTCGVSWSARENRWLAKIKINYKHKFLGQFKYKKDAVKARKNAEKKYGFHENHGRDWR